MEKDKKKGMSLGDWGRLAVYIGLPVFVISFSNVVLRFRNPGADDHKGWLRAAIGTNNWKRAKEALGDLTESEPNNIRNHYWYIKAHFELSDNEERNDGGIFHKYSVLADSGDPNAVEAGFEVDVGRFGLSYYFWKKKAYKKGEQWFKQIENRDIEYVNYLGGCIFLKKEKYKRAEVLFRKEIELGGNVSSSVYRLVKLYYEQGRLEEIGKFLSERQYRGFVPNSIARRYYLHSGQIGNYILRLGYGVATSINLVGFLGAVLIAIVWINFLRCLDVFEPEKMKYVLMTFAGGGILSFGALILYDIYEFGFDFEISGGWVNDLLYCVYGIGMIEELVKILPLLLMIKFTKEVNESIDYLIYAALGALGFSFVENLLYFDSMSLYIIGERGMLCSMGHMMYSCLIAYGILLAKYRGKGKVLGNFVLFFFLACIWHGLYDFFLISKSVPNEFKVFSLLIKFVSIVLLSRMIRNALNMSEFFESKGRERLIDMRGKLALWLIGIVLFEYVCLAAKYGPELAYIQFSKFVGLTWILVFFFAVGLGRYELVKGSWIWLLASKKRKKEEKQL
jgi:RsiW-degrading membrane proteinase PrsW (M82 family)